MSTHPSSPTPPLITMVGSVILALDPEHGTKRWSCSDLLPYRVLVGDEVVFISTNAGDHNSLSEVFCLDLYTGEKRRSVRAVFNVSAALANGNRFYFSGRDGAMCLSAKGDLLWMASLEVASKSFLGDQKFEVICRDSLFNETWRMPAQGGGNAFLALGGAVAQPDFTF